MKIAQVANGLTSKGKRELLKLIANNAKDSYIDALIAGWYNDITYNTHEDGTADIEIGSLDSATGNPVTYRFTGDEVTLEEIEIEEVEELVIVDYPTLSPGYKIRFNGSDWRLQGPSTTLPAILAPSDALIMIKEGKAAPGAPKPTVITTTLWHQTA